MPQSSTSVGPSMARQFALRCGHGYRVAVFQCGLLRRKGLNDEPSEQNRARVRLLSVEQDALEPWQGLRHQAIGRLILSGLRRRSLWCLRHFRTLGETAIVSQRSNGRRAER